MGTDAQTLACRTLRQAEYVRKGLASTDGQNMRDNDTSRGVSPGLQGRLESGTEKRLHPGHARRLLALGRRPVRISLLALQANHTCDHTGDVTHPMLREGRVAGPGPHPRALPTLPGPLMGPREHHHLEARRGRPAPSSCSRTRRPLRWVISHICAKVQLVRKLPQLQEQTPPNREAVGHAGLYSARRVSAGEVTTRSWRRNTGPPWPSRRQHLPAGLKLASEKS